MPGDRYLESAANYAEMGKSNEDFINEGNKRILADVKARTAKWAEATFEESLEGTVPNLRAGYDNFCILASWKEFVAAQTRFARFPWQEVAIIVGPSNSLDLLVDKKAEKIVFYSTFADGAFFTLEFGDADVRLHAKSFREKEGHDLMKDVTVFERVGAGLEVLDWVHDVIDLRRNPREE